MSSQDLLYNISLNARETEDVMNALADKANLLSSLQKKIFTQAIQQKDAFESYLNEKNEAVEPAQEVIEEPTQTKKSKKKEAEAV